ncbi:RidA family protein [Azovibrio restrictus]|uniref:RidA family protein n=1 Tax=Azovibrio restrictus TaxID=146938 RepID=UPI0026F35542|nr:RidA family protein [Azovibrio restrictus]MDD3484330.1 RidA family protein [Azovibrio restrictus]
MQGFPWVFLFPAADVLWFIVSFARSLPFRESTMNSIVRLNPSTLPNAGEMGYSQISIVEPGRMAYISGQVAWRPDGQAVPNNLAEQMSIVSLNAKAALDAVGAAPHDVVIARVFVVNLTPERLEELMPPFLATFSGAQPCITGVGVAALAAPDLQVEMELVVRLPD